MSPEPARILLIGNFLSRRVGTRAVGEDLAERLEAIGWPVTTTSGRRRSLARLLDMQGTIWRARYDAAQVDVYSHAAFVLAESACWSLARRRIPFVLTLRGGELPDFAARWPRRARRLLGSAHSVNTPSRYLLTAMEPYRADLQLLPNPLAIDQYPFALRARARPRLVWLRAFHRTYNPEMAPRVVARLARDLPDVRLTMIGPDKGDGSLARTRKEAAALGVAERITFAGAVPKPTVPAHLAPFDVFLNTTNADNTPVSVMEAMACGLCVISTDVGGIRYLLDDGEDALLVAPDAPDEMAAAVRRVIADPAFAARLSANARQKAEGFDWSRILPLWRSALADAARQRRAR